MKLQNANIEEKDWNTDVKTVKLSIHIKYKI